jgi:bifunctional non-homologous end joining protein LigD
VTIARAIKRLCDEIDLPCYVKSSGSTGLHLLIPLGRQFNYEQSRTLGHLIANLIVAEYPEISTLKRVISEREGKVYLDFLQNRHGQLMVAPFSVRARPEAPVSTPLRWSEVTRKLDIHRFTIQTVPRRLRRMTEDPMRPVLTEKPDLLASLRKLDARLGDQG